LKPVRIITTLSAVFFLAYGPLEPALPLYSRDVLRAGAAGYGLLWSGFGAGALLGLLAIPLAIRYPRPGVTFAVIAILWGLLLAPLVLLTNLPLAMLFLSLAGCAWAPYATVETSLVQRLTPAHLRGQVFGARGTVLVAATPLGVLIGGLLLAKLSAPAVIGISALACIVAGGGGLLSSTLRSITRGGEPGNAMPVADTPELPPRPNVP
jgi:MFS family permease